MTLLQLRRTLLLAQDTLVVAALAFGARPLAAQQRPRRELTRTSWGHVLDYARDGVWRSQARQVAAYRSQLLAVGDVYALNAPMRSGAPSNSAAAVSGTYRVPAVLFRFKDVGTAASRDSSIYTQVLFGSPPYGGRPYSLRTYYEQVSHGLLSIQGRAVGWVTLDSNEATYTGVAGTCPSDPTGNNNCNGINSPSAFARMQAGLVEALEKIDPQVDFSQYDSDHDGFVDLVIFVQSEQDGACVSPTNNHIWAHRATLQTPYVTGDGVRVRDYTIQSGLGGSTACDISQLMPVGTTAHETGHGFALPDLYDTQSSSEGIGEWGLMGSGNYTSPLSPSRMEAWSLNQLGWITLVPDSVNGTVQLSPVATSDTAYYIRPLGANPDGEYYLIENRQGGAAGESDSAVIRYHCAVSGNPVDCGGGLLVWHVDSLKIYQGEPFNVVNTGPVHGLRLEEADGLAQLMAGSNRGDAGDPYPGTAGNTRFSYDTNPANTLNSGGTFAGFELDSIKQVVAGGAMSFKVSFGGPTVVQAADTIAKVTVDGTKYGRFAQLLTPGTSHTVGMDSAQVTSDGLTQYLWASWSNGKSRSDTIVASVSGDSITASVSLRFRMRASASTGGAITSNPSGNLAAGIYVPKDATIAVKATPDSGKVFTGWTGDTTSTADSLLIVAKHAYTLAASFQDKLVAAARAPPGPVMGSAYSYQLQATGGVGTYSWQVSSGALPDGLTLSTAGLVSGVPAKTGDFSSSVRTTSGTQTDSVTLAFTVTAPTLVTADVVSQILGTRTPLNADQRRYLDLLGNDNGAFDVGDFLAWVSATGAASPAIAAVMEALGVHRPGGRP